MIDFIQENNDIFFNGVEFGAVTDINENVRQRLKVRLQRFFGEWFLDTTKGVDYFGVVKVKNPNVEVINSLLKSECLKESLIESIEFWESDIDPRKRVFKILDTTILKLKSGDTINFGVGL